MKLKRAGRSLGGLLWCRESGNRVVGSRSSSKKGWHMASMADNRCVGVYSKSAEMRSMASGGALRKTWSWSASFPAVSPASDQATEGKRQEGDGIPY